MKKVISLIVTIFVFLSMAAIVLAYPRATDDVYVSDSDSQSDIDIISNDFNTTRTKSTPRYFVTEPNTLEALKKAHNGSTFKIQMDGIEVLPNTYIEVATEKNITLKLVNGVGEPTVNLELKQIMTKDELEKQTMKWKNNYILKLEKQIEKMKNCCNCKYCDSFDNPTY